MYSNGIRIGAFCCRFVFSFVVVILDARVPVSANSCQNTRRFSDSYQPIRKLHQHSRKNKLQNTYESTSELHEHAHRPSTEHSEVCARDFQVVKTRGLCHMPFSTDFVKEGWLSSRIN